MEKDLSKHPVNEKLPLGKMFTYGLQHVLAMYAGAVVVPLIVGGALGLTSEQIIFLISADLFTCGIATLIQTIGFWKCGIRIPVIQGVTFACVQPVITIGLGVKGQGGTAEEALAVIFCSVMIGGLFTFLLAPLFSKFIHLFPPIVTGSVILVIGLSLMPVAINMIGGQGVYIDGKPAAYGSPSFLLIAFVVIITILCGNRFLTGFWKNISVLIGMAIGYVIAMAMGYVNYSKVGTSALFGIDLPFGMNMPGFGGEKFFAALSDPVFAANILPAAIAMIIVMIIVMVESTGDFIAIGEVIDLPIGEKEVARGLRADGLSTFLGGCLNALPYTAFAQNVGLVALTGVRSRFVVACSGVILICLGLVPKLAAVIDSFPAFVIGGAGFVMFSTVAANGIKALTKAELDTKPNNIFIVALSVGVGLIPTVGSLITSVSGLNIENVDVSHFVNQFLFFSRVPSGFGPLVSSGISLTAITAILLNIFFNGVSKSTDLHSLKDNNFGH